MSVLTGDERHGGFSPRADKREDERHEFAGTLSTSSSASRGESFQLRRRVRNKKVRFIRSLRCLEVKVK